MSTATVVIIFVAALIVAAKLLLVGERRPPVLPVDPTLGSRDSILPTLRDALVSTEADAASNEALHRAPPGE